jgi:hypothetical protein
VVAEERQHLGPNLGVWLDALEPRTNGIRLEVEGLPDITAKVCWRRDGSYGLSFEDTFQFAELASLAFDLQRESAAVEVKPAGNA